MLNWRDHNGNSSDTLPYRSRNEVSVLSQGVPCLSRLRSLPVLTRLADGDLFGPDPRQT